MKRKPHTNITRNKIALANTGKIFSRERCDAIRKGKFDATKLTQEEENEFKRLMLLGYVPVQEIQRVLKIKRKRFARFVQEFDLQMPIAFIPSDLSESEGRLILEAAKLRVHFSTIADIVGRHVRQIKNIIKKFEKRFKFVYSYDRACSQGETKPERFVRQILEKHDVKFNQQFGIGQLLYDFHITGTTLLIEVQGDYWHANPQLYPNGPVYQSQKSNVKRDHFKRRKAKDNGYWVWYIWEHDIITRPKHVESEIVRRVARAIDNNRDIF